MSGALYTIGYGGVTYADFEATLRGNHIDLVIDVREKPYSKSQAAYREAELRKALWLAGIAYAHDPALGNPWRPDIERFAQLLSDEPHRLDKLRFELHHGRRIALLCGCVKVAVCHRSVLAAHLGGARHLHAPLAHYQRKS